MKIDKIIVTIVGFIGIIFTYWFFLRKTGGKAKINRSAKLSNLSEIDVVVDGGYSPEIIYLKRGKTTKINFIRKDSSSCLEEIVLADFKIRRYLPLNQKVTIEVTVSKAGEFIYSCGMNMYHGKIIVE